MVGTTDQSIIQILTRLSVFIILSIFVIACNDSEDGSSIGQGITPVSETPRMEMQLVQGASGVKNLSVTVTLQNAGDTSADYPVLSSDGGVFTSPASTGNSTYTADFIATHDSSEVRITAAYQTLSQTQTALIMAEKNAFWGVAEPVPGLVNSLGHEDSSEISPDGKWLLVSTYSPTSIVCCMMGHGFYGIFSVEICEGCTDGDTAKDNKSTATHCNISRGPYTTPERPDMPGKNRIISNSSIDHSNPAMNLPDSGWQNVPVAAYGFKQQADGSFGEPFVFGMDWDGYTWGAPFGVTFWDYNSTSLTPRVLLTFDDPLPTETTGNDIYTATLNLGSTTIFGKFRDSGGGLERTDFLISKVGMDHADSRGNPFYNKQTLFVDHEESTTDHDIFFTHASGDPENLIFPALQTIGISKKTIYAGKNENQPFMDANRLYYAAMNFTQIAASDWDGTGDMALDTSWNTPVVHLRIDGTSINRVNGITTLGEPSLSTDSDGKRWLYFVYGVRRSWGIDTSIARVRER